MVMLDLGKDGCQSDVATPRMTALVVGRREVAENTVEVSLSRTDGESFPAWEPGAHVDLVLPDGDIRQYSLCGRPNSLGSYEICVLLEAGGKASKFVGADVRRGTEIVVGQPRNHFALVPAASYVFIAGGVGIAPIRPMVKRLANSGTSWALHYAAKSEARMAYYDELSAFEGHSSFYVSDKGSHMNLDEILKSAPINTAVYCCGPARMIEELTERARGVDGITSHVERFAPVPRQDASYRVFQVKLARSGKVLTIPPDKSVIDVLADAGVFVPCSCKEGTCGSCEVGVLNGIPDHRDSVLSDEERADNTTMMVCVSRAKTPMLTLDL